MAEYSIPTIRIKANKGHVLINRNDFDHDEHELLDPKESYLLPPRAKKVAPAEAADLEDVTRQLAEATDKIQELQSEREELIARAEAAEDRAAQAEDHMKKLAEAKGNKGGK